MCDGIINCKHGNDEIFCPDMLLQQKCLDICVCSPNYNVSCSSSIFTSSFNLSRLNDYKMKQLSLFNFKNLKLKLYSKDIVYLLIYNSTYKNFSSIFPLSNLIYLKLIKTNLKTLSEIFYYKKFLLQYLNISYNPCDSLIGYQFLPNLMYFDISYTKIKNLRKEWFENLKYLKLLKMRNLNIKTIDKNFLTENQVEYLDLSSTKYSIINSYRLIKNLKFIKNVKNDYYNLCCFVKYYQKNTFKNCIPEKSLINSCLNILESNISRIILWIYGITGTLSNVISILFRFFCIKRPSHYFSLFMSVGDFLTGIYLILLGSIDISFRGSFFENEYEWKNSFLCFFLSMLMNFSLLFSTSNLFLMTLDKYYSISHPNKKIFGKMMTIGSISLSGVVCLCIAFSLSFNSKV